MPIRSDIGTEALLTQFRAQRATFRGGSKKSEAGAGTSQAVRMDVRLQAQVSASTQSAAQASEDRVEISLAANMTVEAVNGILDDSVVEQINKAIQEAGINLRVEDGQEAQIDPSPEGTARGVVDFATGFLEAFLNSPTDETGEVRIAGFMSLIRGAIREGFHQARNFLEGITTLSETINENINRTFELANQYLDDFHQAQLNLMQASEGDRATEPAEPVEGSDTPTEAVV